MALIKPLSQEEKAAKVKSLNASVQLPRNQYAIRFIDEKSSPSKSSGNNMVTLTAEIVAPSVITSPFTGEQIEIAGAQLKPHYLSLEAKSLDEDTKQMVYDEEATREAITRYTDYRTKCGLDNPEEGIDPANPPLGFKGVVIDAILDSEEYMQRATPTPEQKAKGQLGTPINDPATGKPLVSYKPFIAMVLGPSNVDVSHMPMLS